MSGLSAVTFLHGGLMGPKGDKGAPATPYSFRFRTAVPFFLPAGTTTAGFRWTDANGGCSWSNVVGGSPTWPQAWAWFDAGKINGLNEAGWYYMEASSSSYGKVYSNRYTSGDPAAAMPAVGAGAELTGTVPDQYLSSATNVEIAGPSIIIPAGVVAPSAKIALAVHAANSAAGSAGKAVRVYIGATQLLDHNNVTGKDLHLIGDIIRSSSGNSALFTCVYLDTQATDRYRQLNSINWDADNTLSVRMLTATNQDSIAIVALDIVVWL